MTGSASGSGGSGGSRGGAGTSAGSSGGSGSTSTACAACKYQRRKCTADCPLSPYFPPDQPKRFQNVHRLFGVSNILRILKHVDPSKREDTVKSISYEADTREKDPVHGCLGVITILQNQVYKLKDELAVAREQLFLLQQEQHNFNQQGQLPQTGSSLGGSTSILNVSSAQQQSNVLMPNFQSYNDMTDFVKSNPLSISSFEPDQFLRNDGFDLVKPGGGASSSRFDAGRIVRAVPIVGRIEIFTENTLNLVVVSPYVDSDLAYYQQFAFSNETLSDRKLTPLSPKLSHSSNEINSNHLSELMQCLGASKQVHRSGFPTPSPIFGTAITRSRERVAAT